jgi:colanic acid biosynthesis glycosyl transferase WcaI
VENGKWKMGFLARMKILLLNQCFYPDVVSTAQHLTDLAVALSEKGHEVTVIAGDRGYDDPSMRFPRRETWKGIRIIRIPALALGKSSRWRRALNFSSFLVHCVMRLLFLPRFDVVVALTSPPLISLLGTVFTKLKGGVFYFWIMDLNPDEAIAAGWLKEQSLTARSLERLLRYSLRRGRVIFVLDRFMKERIQAKGIAADKITVLPPWSHDDAISFDRAGRESFRAANDLSDKFVIMYSGNHSPCHPLDTVLEAARELSSHDNCVFCFVGGGSEQRKVKLFAERHQLLNVKCLPYQKLTELAGSLSAADLHVVVMGDQFAGIVHPCKVYNILTIGTPFLYIGPPESHVVDIVAETNDVEVYSSLHGDVQTVVSSIVTATERPKFAHGHRRSEVAQRFAKDVILPRMIAALEGSAEKDGRFVPNSQRIREVTRTNANPY